MFEPPQNTKIAVCVTCFGRIEVLRKCLGSLRANPEFDSHVDLWLFVDKSTESEVGAIRDLAESLKFRKLGMKVSSARLYNERNIIRSRNYLFEWENYESVLSFDSDNLASPHYVGLMLRLLEWASSQYPCVVGSSIDCTVEAQLKTKALPTVVHSFSTGGNLLMNRQVWWLLRPVWDYYDRRWLDTPPQERRHPEIRAWAASFADLLVRHPEYEAHTFASGMAGTSVDAVTMIGAGLRGVRALFTKVNRLVNIGEHGMLTTPETFGKLRDVKLDVFDEDKTLNSFAVEREWIV